MTKADNHALVVQMVSSQYWLHENRGFLADGFTLEMPYAPPGIPQHLDAIGTMLHMNWLSRTVKTWDLMPGTEIHGTKDPNLFWAVRTCQADVHWAGINGMFESRILSKVLLENGKISKMVEFANPLKFFRAIGVGVPFFEWKMNHESVARWKVAEATRGKQPDCGDDPAAIAKRIKGNLALFFDTEGEVDVTPRTFTPDFEMRVWGLPPDMKEIREGDERIEAFTYMENAVTEKILPGTVIYQTDDPDALFLECRGDGIFVWPGNNNNQPGHYQQRYVFFYRFEKGNIKVEHEYLNPVNKFNSINKPFPAFPYYY